MHSASLDIIAGGSDAADRERHAAPCAPWSLDVWRRADSRHTPRWYMSSSRAGVGGLAPLWLASSPARLPLADLGLVGGGGGGRMAATNQRDFRGP